MNACPMHDLTEGFHHFQEDQGFCIINISIADSKDLVICDQKMIEPLVLPTQLPSESDLM
jgi:hypothetical protein